MTDNTTRNPDEPGPDGRSGVRPIHVRAVVEAYDDRPAECTLFPVDVMDRDARLTAWITAMGDAFVDLDAAR